MIATTWPPALPSEQQPEVVVPSSNRTITMPFVPSAGSIEGTHLFNHASPVAIEHECMSLHSFGEIQANRGRPFVRSVRSWVSGTIFLQRLGSPRTSL